jgi:hypothetical protein
MLHAHVPLNLLYGYFVERFTSNTVCALLVSYVLSAYTPHHNLLDFDVP